jgi:hypothetical protein
MAVAACAVELNGLEAAEPTLQGSTAISGLCWASLREQLLIARGSIVGQAPLGQCYWFLARFRSRPCAALLGAMLGQAMPGDGNIVLLQVVFLSTHL